MISAVVRKETLHQEFRILLVADVLGQAHAPVLHTIDKCAHAVVGGVGQVIDRLGYYPPEPHQDDGDTVHQEDVSATDRRKQAGVERLFELYIQEVHRVVNHQRHDESHHHGQRHPLQVDERGIPYYPRISLEYLEANHRRHHIHENALRHKPHIVEGIHIVIPVYDKPGDIADEYIDEKDYPVG